MVSNAGFKLCMGFSPFTNKHPFFLLNFHFSPQKMDVDDENKSISKIVDDVLEDLGFTENRAAKMDVDDLLK